MEESMWFRKTFNGLLWRPISWQGWAVTGLWIIANLWYFFRVDAESHSASDTLLGAAPFFVVSTILFLFIVRYRGERRWE